MFGSELRAMDAATREQMILSEQPLVRRLAKQMYFRGSRRIPLDDLIQYGHIGLIRAVDRYDGSVLLHDYVKHRVKGAILDGIREEDVLSRCHRADVQRWYDAQPATVQDVGWPPHNVRITAAAKVPAAGHSPEDLAHAAQARQAINSLSPQLTWMLYRYFVDGLTLEEVGEEMGLGLSRTHQLVHIGCERAKLNL